MPQMRKLKKIIQTIELPRLSHSKPRILGVHTYLWIMDIVPDSLGPPPPLLRKRLSTYLPRKPGRLSSSILRGDPKLSTSGPPGPRGGAVGLAPEVEDREEPLMYADTHLCHVPWPIYPLRVEALVLVRVELG